uniref:uncharacterized protein LOC114590979 n=1 Tax=Podarcis muralis TaxID=64176 RepID=UPI00109F9B5F|nr:uncharacterized protein LOC114590979 [Podarcis muralis]
MERKRRHPFVHEEQSKRNKLSLPGEAAAMAASGGPVQDLCEEATCPICLESFRDPVIIPECGHNFCRSCLIQCWGESEGEASCPQCREILQHRNLIPNRPLANVLEKLRLQGEKETEGKGKICEKHQEPLKLFCKEDESPICVVCDRSKEHKSHEVVPLEEASQEYKDQISTCLDNTKKEREKFLVFKADAEKESQDLLKQTVAEREKMVAEIRRLHQFLEEQEKRILAQMAEVEKEIAAKREEHLARLSRELSSLDSLIREMEEKLQEPESELLQDIGSFLQRSQEKENLEDPPVAFPPALKWRIWDVCDMSLFLDGVMKKFRDTVENGLQLRKENVTLDPDTANPYLILSEDRKSVREGDFYQDLPDNPERFDTHGFVLGCEGFTSGRHFWEVTVGREEGWGVGVARKSVKRKGVVSFDATEGIWCFGNWVFGYDPHEAPVPSEKPKRIRVALNCEGGQMSFYDADTAALLYTFPAASFSGETLQPLFYVRKTENLTLSSKEILSHPLERKWKHIHSRAKSKEKGSKLSLPGEAAAMAASGGPVQDLCEEATCPICLEYFRDPVIIPECGHNFCRACLTQCWGESEGEASCPQCREIIQHRNLIPNRPLQNVVEILVAEKVSLPGEKGAEGKGKICEKHQEPLKLFCKEEEAPICVVCDRSKEHKKHEVIPLEEASQEYKDQLRNWIEILKKETRETLAVKADFEKESQDLLKRTDSEREKMVAEFRRLRQFLEALEKNLLARMAEVEKEVARKSEEHLARLSEKLSSLENRIKVMQEKFQQPASQLLQDIRSFLQRSRAKQNLQDPPVAFPPALKWRIWDFCDINPFLMGVMNKFRESLRSGLQLKKENVTLDPGTAHSLLILSGDLKSVRKGERHQDILNNPKRFDYQYYVLGREAFREGRHFWEVAVGSEGEWAVGVARESVKRKGEFIPGPKEGFWRIGKWSDQYRVSTRNGPPVSILGGEPKRIRVALNCEGGRVSFYDADTAALLHSFSEASFSGETLQPFFYVSKKGILKLSA